MIREDRDALICDLAETYGIYDFKALPVSTLAALSVGLRDNSRIKMRLTGQKISQTEALLAAAVDRLSLLLWIQTESAKTGANRPASVLDELLGHRQEESDMVVFESPEEFEAAWERITGVKHG